MKKRSARKPPDVRDDAAEPQCPVQAAVERIFNELVRAGRISHSADQINYTDDFDLLYLLTRRDSHCGGLTRNEVSCRLINGRKAGRCKAPRKESRNGRGPGLFGGGDDA